MSTTTEVRKQWHCYDSQCRETIEAKTAADAAHAWVEGGDWNSENETTWVTVWVEEEGEEDGYAQSFTIAIPAIEPECCADSHDWRTPHSLLGGLEENPGCFGSGGGIKYTEVCCHCGAYKTVDTWAQDPETGEQGLTKIQYREADCDSLEWLNARALQKFLNEIEEEGEPCRSHYFRTAYPDQWEQAVEKNAINVWTDDEQIEYVEVGPQQ